MANFFIQIDKPFYFAGDTINGNILVNVVQPLPSTGISLKFTGYECAKMSVEEEIIRPIQVEGQPPRPDPIAAIPPHHIVNRDNFDVSDVDEVEFRNVDHRPKYIRKSDGRVFKMRYHDTRNVFTSAKTMVYACNGLGPGQYSFPISFKTFEGWPASFNYYTPQKKGKIVYHMTAAIEPTNPMFQLSHAIEITMRQTRQINAASKSSTTTVTSCCCIGKGTAAMKVHFEKDGYMQNEDVRMIIEIDNSQCKANIKGVDIAVVNTVTLRAGSASDTDTYNVFTKRTQGLPAGGRMEGNQAMKQSFKLVSNKELKPTCSGKLLTSFFNLNVRLNFDICECCSAIPAVSLSIIIFPNIREYQLPPTFSSNWVPTVMPLCVFALPNTFANFNIHAMSMQNNYPPPMNPPNMGMNTNANVNTGGMSMNANMGGGINVNVHVNDMSGQHMAGNRGYEMTDRPIY